MALDIRQTVRGKVPRVRFEKIADKILGKHYCLSLVICGDALARRLNVQHRKKTYKPNVLCFPLSKVDGEIILNVRKAAREARTERTSTEQRAAFLFIHACLHLRGYDHGDYMDSLERQYVRWAGYKTIH